MRSYRMPRLAQQQTQVQRQCAQQQDAVEAPELFIPGQQEHQQTGADHQRNVEAHQLPRHAQRNDQRRQAEGHQNIEDTAADHTADRNVRGMRLCRLQADGHLRRTAAKRDHGETDDQWPHMQASSQAHSRTHHQFGTEDQQAQPGEQFDQADQRQIG